MLLEGSGWFDRLRPSRDPARFWEHLQELPAVDRSVPPQALEVLKRALPSPDLAARIVHRTAGMGSLGRPRYCAVAEWHGGPVAREAKAWAPSAWAWANDVPVNGPSLIKDLLAHAARAPDPNFLISDGWIVRRLAPDCDKIDDAPDGREAKVLSFMAAQTANVHGGDAAALRAVSKDLAARPSGWLKSAVKEMLKCVHKDWEAWATNPSYLS